MAEQRPERDVVQNPVKDTEPQHIDSGDQMPSEQAWWGDADGRQSQLIGRRPKDRWLHTLWRKLRGDGPRGPETRPRA